MKNVKIIIGKNFGDEGKGLMTDYFINESNAASLVVKHNGGAQAGHTVMFKNRRFVFHQYGSGSFHGANTLWAEHFLPDLIKVSEEAEEFCKVARVKHPPQIYASSSIYVTLIYDVLLNQLIESLRKDKKHGSCGMGIWEAYLRSKDASAALTIGEVTELSVAELADRLGEIQSSYVRTKLICLQDEFPCVLNEEQKQLVYLLFDKDIRMNAAVKMKENVKKYVTVIADDADEMKKFLDGYETVVFETGQGLCLDFDCEEYYPNLTASKTDSSNVWDFFNRYEIPFMEIYLPHLVKCEVCYVTRSYVTRHGVGKLPNECDVREIGESIFDETNEPNPWQGELRYAKHGDFNDFYIYVEADMEKAPDGVIFSVAITHLNETDGKYCTVNGNIEIEKYFHHCITTYYKSYSRSSSETRAIVLT